MGEIKIGRIVMGSYGTNCYFLYREGEGRVIFVDPADRGAQIAQTMQKNGFTVEAILLTHAHFDHIWGSKELREATGAKIYALDEEKLLCGNARANVSEQAGRPYTLEPDEYLHDGQEMTLADMTFRVIATPGHTGGSCCYYFAEPGFLVSGDTLFADSVGRTDFPTGSMSALVRSIREKLFVLPDETKVYPGHGDSTTVGHERRCNPYAAQEE